MISVGISRCSLSRSVMILPLLTIISLVLVQPALSQNNWTRATGYLGYENEPYTVDFFTGTAYGVDYGTGNGIFVAVGAKSTSEGLAMWSTDGQNWNYANISAAKGLNSVEYYGGRFVAAANHQIYTSADGKNWSAALSDSLPLWAYHFYDVTHGSSGWVAICSDQQVGYRIVSWTSGDGAVWTQRNAIDKSEILGAQTRIAAGGGVYVSPSSASFASRSADGIGWTQPATPTSGFKHICYANGSFYAANGEEVYKSSNGGLNWTKQGDLRSIQPGPSNLVYVKDRFYAMHSGTSLMQSFDCVSWYGPGAGGEAMPNHPRWLYDATYGDGKYVMVGEGGIYSAPDESLMFPGATSIGAGWKWLDWFGYYYDAGNGWINHAQHGWMFCVGNAGTGIWMYDREYDLWLWSRSSFYPSMYSSGDKAWLWYQKGSKSPRWFVNLGSGQWVNLP